MQKTSGASWDTAVPFVFDKRAPGGIIAIPVSLLGTFAMTAVPGPGEVASEGHIDTSEDM
jgi:hypothetical protein